jgi:hypothetical protein
MRIALHQEMILERPRLAFVGVAGDVARLDFLVDELPLHAGRKPGAAAAAQPRRLHHLDDFIRLLGERRPQPFVAVVLDVEIQRGGVGFANVGDQKGIHLP